MKTDFHLKEASLFALAALGLAGGCAAAYLYGLQQPALPPVFSPAVNPFSSGIYAEGIVESDQANGENINLYPEVAGTVAAVAVSEGQAVHRGDVLVQLDDTIPRASAGQQQSAAAAAHAQLDEMRAQPRRETLDVAEAQVAAAAAALKTATDERNKQQAAWSADPKSVSQDAVDSAVDAAAAAAANLDVARRQRDLTQAGAWQWDLQVQQRQADSLDRALEASRALLGKYALRAPADGVVLAINTMTGAYVSPQGAYDSYTQALDPVVVVGAGQARLHVRVYVDEILVPRLPAPARMQAQMSIRGADIKLPLRFLRVQPIVSPKIELSDQRQERVDVRVLPVIFDFDKPANLSVYPGELVDVYIGQ